MVIVKRTLVALLTFFVMQAHAGLILFTDRDAFENAANSPLAFDGFNDKDLTEVILSSGTNFHKYRTTSSHISEGTHALSIRERDYFTVNFNHDVFAIGFDLNELNGSNLHYSDSAGHEILDALKVTDIWNESTFFGVISDTAIRSFTLTGNGDQSLLATYGFDALSYTADSIAVPAPSSWLLMIAAFIAVLLIRTNRKHQV